MPIFACLPYLDYCCYCISLKLGSVLIVIYTILSFAACLGATLSTGCGEDGGSYKEIMDIAMYVMLGVNGLTVVAAIVFLFGIIQAIPELAKVFMYVITLSILVNLAYAVMAIVFSILEPEPCSRYLMAIAPGVIAILWMYFLIVVHSYEEKALD